MSQEEAAQKDIKRCILDALRDNENIANSAAFAESHGLDHQGLIGVLKSLQSQEIIETSVTTEKLWKLSEEGKSVLSNGSPEFCVYTIVKEKGELLKKQIVNILNGKPEDFEQNVDIADSVDKIKIKAIKTKGEEIFDIAISNGLKLKMLRIRKDTSGNFISALGENVGDKTKELCEMIQKSTLENAKDIEFLKKRQLIYQVIQKTFLAQKGEYFDKPRKEVAVDLTREMLISKTWVDKEFKPYNLSAQGVRPLAGSLHPLMKVREEFRTIFLEMGFTEMETSNYVESSFWNFDALFVPQNHPARDMQDTFYVADPALAESAPAEYIAATKKVHEKGEGCDSKGYVCKWSADESRKNVLRTHTTAVTARVLYDLAQQSSNPSGKFFSIDRVFRNEEMDKTHLCEFHQIEGVVIDEDLSLVQMMTMLKDFFQRIGIEKLRFKPAYNPYTEPSMEIFGYHEGHQKWIEVGNSGMFRPEMLQPMGFSKKVTAIAWGLSLERPTMIKYGLKSIHDLFGHRIDLSFCRRAPLYRV